VLFEWALVILGTILVMVAGLVMPLQLARMTRPLGGLRISDLAVPFLRHPLLTTLIWALEIVAAYFGRTFLIQFVGDVAAYIAAHTVSKFWDLRQQIWQTAMKVADAVYRARTTSSDDLKKDDSRKGDSNKDDAKKDTKQPGFLYEKIVVVGHSLGSVIGYDVLNGLLLEDAFSKQPLHVAARTRMFLTFGSPLDKTAFLFKTQRDMDAPVRAVGAASVQPMIQHYDNRPQEWINLWSPSDLISGNLDYYDPPTEGNASQKAVQNMIDPEATTPLAAHVEYWGSELFARQLVRGIRTRVAQQPHLQNIA
jgi:hypothetical protein